MKILAVVGARPNFVKMAPLIAEMRGRGIQYSLVHTGQHYSESMSESQFRDLDLPRPDYNLNVGPGSQVYQTARVMAGMESVFDAERPDVVLVVGDVNSTLGAALAAAKAGIPVAHVESGLRCFVRGMQEEINRTVTDSVSEFLFASEESAVTNLRREGHPMSRIHAVGNVMIDALNRFSAKASKSKIAGTLGLSPLQYGALTLHRNENLDSECRMSQIARSVKRLAEEIKIVFPAHPRTRRVIKRYDFGRAQVVAPLSYTDFLNLETNAMFVLTDSGGVQEETSALGVPCITLRDETERQVTVDRGTSVLVGANADLILFEAGEAMEGRGKRGAPIPYWDGHASERIIDVLMGVYR